MTISLRYGLGLCLATFIFVFFYTFASYHRGVVESSAQVIAVRSHASAKATNAKATSGQASPARNYGNLPMSFEANFGQASQAVRFLARGRGYGLFLTGDEAVLALYKAASSKDKSSSVRSLRMRLVGGHPSPQLAGAQPLPTRSHYFIGADAGQWHTDVAHYSKVLYKGVYPGIDLIYYGKQRQLEYDFVVAPGADPSTIQLAFSGADDAHLNARGDLVFGVGSGAVVQQAPIIYQTINGQRKTIEGRFELARSARGQAHRVSFQVGSYDKTRPLIIDPVLSYSSYLGGSSADIGNDIAVSAAGEVYVVGQTLSTDFPVRNAVDATAGSGSNIFVSKLNAAGTALDYSTYIGGSGDDIGHDLALDSSGNVYVTGETTSTNFPTVNARQGFANGARDAVVVKLNATGSALSYSTYLGGLSDDVGYGIAVDAAGSAYVTGSTKSLDFLLLSALQISLSGSEDAFLTKFTSNGSSVSYSTFLGGANSDTGYDVAVDSAGNAYVAGTTTSSDFPTLNPLQANRAAGADAFVTKVNASGSAFAYSTYLGGSGNDRAFGVAVDGAGKAHVAGETSSTDFPRIAATQTSLRGSQDAFVSLLSPSGTGLNFSTYLGGSNADSAQDIAIDNGNQIYVAGRTTSTDFPVTNAFQPAAGGSEDAFVTKFKSSLSIEFSSYLGGRNSDRALGVAVDGNENIYLTGATESLDFPTPHALQPNNAGGTEAFVTKIVSPKIQLTISPITFSEGGGARAAVGTITITNNIAGAVTLTLASSDTSKVTVPATITIPAGSNTGTFSVSAVDNGLVDGSSTVTLTASVLGFESDTATVTVTDDDVPELSLDIRPTSFSETAGTRAATATLSRNTDTSTELTVALSNSDPAHVSVPASITIPVGALSVTFGVEALNDAIADGPDSLTLTARAAGFQTATATATVTDDEVPTLTITISPTTFSEAVTDSQNPQVTIRRNTPTQNSLVVRVSSSDTTRLPVSSAVTIPAGSATVTFAVSPTNDTVAQGTPNITLTASATGFVTDTVIATVTDDDVQTLTLSLADSIVNEGDGANATTGRVSRNTPTNVALGVNLSSSNTSRVRVPATVTIPIGATSVTFAVEAVDNVAVEGTQTVSIRASRSGFVADTATLNVTDNDVAPTPTPGATPTPGPTPTPQPTATPRPTPTAAPGQSTLTLQITPMRFSEVAGLRAATVVLRRSAPATVAITVRLTSSNPNRVRVPASISLPANVLSVSFLIAAVDNAVVDGNQTITITATATGARTGTATVTVTDNDVPRLSFSVQPATFSEGVGLAAASGTIRRNTPTNVALRVTISSSNVAAVRVPATVTIPIGAASATFRVGAIDDAVVNGTRLVMLTAASSGFIGSRVTLTVTDNDRVGPTPTATPRPTATPQPTATPRPTPTAVPNPTPTPISPLFDWGLNESGQLGDGTRISKNLPQQVRGFGNLIAIDANGSHSLAVTERRQVLSWGFNRFGELGDGSTVNRATPVLVQGLSNVSAIAAGWYHSLALRSDGTVWAWGYNSRGQLGDGTALDRHVPVQVRGLSDVRFIAAGVYHNLAIRRDGTLWAWGANEAGQLGDGTTVDRRLAVRLSGVSSPRTVAAGSAHSLALMSDGSVLAWGANQFGQLGNGGNNRSLVPVRVRGLTGVVEVVAGYVHNVALTSGGRAVAWGSNFYGQLGDNTIDDRNVPVAVQNLSNVRTLAAGTGHTLALLNDGTLRAWGWNEYGQLGDGTRDDRKLPVVVRNLSRISTIAAGYAHNLVLRPPSIVPANVEAAMFSQLQIRVGTDSIRILFQKPLDAEVACDATRYTVSINGQNVELESVAYNTADNSVTLGLPQSTLEAGDTVQVAWNNLRDRAGVIVTGKIGPLVAGQGD